MTTIPATNHHQDSLIDISLLFKIHVIQICVVLRYTTTTTTSMAGDANTTMHNHGMRFELLIENWTILC